MQRKVLGERCWVLEDGSPLLNGSDVLVHVLACAEGDWDLGGGKSKFESGLDVVVSTSVLDVSDSLFNLSFHHCSTLVAGFNLFKVVVTGHAEHETSDEVRDCHNRHVNVCEHLFLNFCL